MAYFTAQELAAVKNDMSRPTATVAPKKPGRGGLAGFVGNVVHGAVAPFEYLGNAAIVNPAKELAAQFTGNKEALRNAERGSNRNLGLGDKGTDIVGGLKKWAGESAQALLAPAAAGTGTIRGAAAVGAGTGAGSALAERDSSLEDVLTGAALGGATAGGIVGGGKILNKLTKAKSATSNAGRRLTEVGSGLKADKNVGGVERLNEQADFMSKYTGTPRQQRVKMEADMKDLSSQVDAHLAVTKTPVVGINMSSKLRSAIDDPNVFPDLDLTQPRAVKLLEKNMKIIGNKTDAQDANNFVKTINPTAVKARDKLSQGLPLTPNETAALATKRVIDEELTSIPEIAPLKKQMAQIFEVTPQVAKASEKGISAPFMTGLTAKAPLQAAKGAASKAGGILTKLSSGLPEVSLPPAAVPAKNFASGIIRQGAAADVGAGVVPEQGVAQPTGPSSTEGQQAQAVTPEDVLAAEADGDSQDTDPYSPANIETAIKNIIAQGGTQKDVAEFLSNAKAVGELSAISGKSNKPISATAADAIANAQAGLTSLDQIEQELAKNPSVQGKEAATQTFNPFGITGKVTGTSNYDTAITQAKDVIARLRTGAAISNSEEARFTKMLPQPADPPDTVQRKIALLRNALTTVVQRVGGNSQDLIQEAAANQ